MSNLAIQEQGFIEQKSMREKCIDRIEVLDSVGNLMLIPEMYVLTTKMVAEYFKVGLSVIEMCYNRNKEEIDLDGVVIKTVKDFLNSQHVGLEKTRGKTAFDMGHGFIVDVSNRGLRCFPKRAVLRIAMLLRDSEIAREIRTQLLNVLEHSTIEQKTKEINTEQEILSEVGIAWATGNIETFAKASQKYITYQNRHIAKIEAENVVLVKDNKILAGETLS